MRHKLQVTTLLMMVVAVVAQQAHSTLELTEFDIFTGQIEITNVSDIPVSGSLLEFCIPLVYGQLESSSFTFFEGESRVYDMVAINPNLSLTAADDLWIYLDRVGGFGQTQFVTTGVVYGSNQAGAGRVNSVVTNTGGEAWADVNDFVDTSSLMPGQTLQLIPPGDNPNSSAGWTIADADFGNFGTSCDFPFGSDGAIDIADFDALADAIVNGPFDECLDLSQDGMLSIADMDQLRAIGGANNLTSGNPYLPGDSNLDGVVDGQDFINWNANKFTSVAAWSAGDFNVDGVVDGQDFIVWNSFKFQSADAVVPEPASRALLMLAVAALIGIRK